MTLNPRIKAPPKPAAAKAAAVQGTRPALVGEGRHAPGVDLYAAVAIEHANGLVNAPTPPAVQAVLDAASTDDLIAARALLKERLAQSPAPPSDDPDGSAGGDAGDGQGGPSDGAADPTLNPDPTGPAGGLKE